MTVASLEAETGLDMRPSGLTAQSGFEEAQGSDAHAQLVNRQRFVIGLKIAGHTGHGHCPVRAEFGVFERA